MKISVVMATLNSMRTLKKSLQSLREQNYPQEDIEILVIDGGSTDGTRELAAQYGCRIIDNPKVEPVSAKIIGFKVATGDLLMHLDSDEVLLSQNALSLRAEIFRQNKDVKMIFSSGYVSPPGVPFAAVYINEFGDPFTQFYYRLSKDARFFVPRLRQLLQIEREAAGYVVFSNESETPLILENAACANCLDLKFFREKFSEIADKTYGPVHFYYHMQDYTRVFAVTVNDAVEHNSVDSLARFLLKIQWRIRNNIFFVNDMGASGFLGRMQFDGFTVRLKRFLYLPYAFLVLPVVVDSLSLVWSRRDVRYLLHIPLTWFTAGMIVGMKLAQMFGYRPEQLSYGDQKAISAPAGPSRSA